MNRYWGRIEKRRHCPHLELMAIFGRRKMVRFRCLNCGKGMDGPVLQRITLPTPKGPTA